MTKSNDHRPAPAFRVAAILEALVTEVHGVLIEAGLERRRADELAHEIVGRIVAEWGGRKVQLPRGRWGKTSLLWFQQRRRNLRIYREYDGTNRREICARYAISSSRLYQIIHDVRTSLKSGAAAADGL